MRRVLTVVVLAMAVLVPLAACGGGGGGSGSSGGSRPAGIFPEFEEPLYAYPQMATSCVPGPEGNGLTCTEFVDKTLQTLHELRDAIKARPDADQYPDTLAEIEKVDQAAADFEEHDCRGNVSLRCETYAHSVLVNKVYTTLQSEDAPARRR